MPVDHIRYDILAREALRGVVRTVLDDTAKHGLPGEHHFYITFDTRAHGVRVPPRITAQFPEEMTIVLQHQFWDLVVKDDSFEVGISFGGIPERLVVPFAAIKGFLDPSVQFVLKFEELAEPVADTPESSPASAGMGAVARPAAEHKAAPPAPTVAAVPKPANPSAGPSNEGPDKPAGGGEVVRLDRFRKK